MQKKNVRAFIAVWSQGDSSFVDDLYEKLDQLKYEGIVAFIVFLSIICETVWSIVSDAKVNIA